MDQPEPNFYLHGIGHFHPENVIDNAFLESLDIGTDNAWILERVGIRARRTVLNLDYIRQTRNAVPTDAAAASVYTNAQTAALAGRMALERAGLQVSDVGLVIAGGCSPQHTIPSEAAWCAAELGITAPCYDLSSACSSFAVQLHHLRGMRIDALPDYVLVINAENTSRTIDYRDRNSAVLWGDCTTAAIVSTRVPSSTRIIDSFMQSDPAGWDKVVIPVGGHFRQQGSAVQAFAIRKTLETVQRLRKNVTATPAQTWFIGHQANFTMLQSICERAEIPADHHLFNVDEFGNGGAAGAPSVLSQYWDKLRAGDEIILAVVGSGLTWGGVLIRREAEVLSTTESPTL